jgi:glycosyltransferase involved in cell wall biosynthesis
MLLALACALRGLGCNSTIAVFTEPGSKQNELQARAMGLDLTVETVPCRGRWDRKAVRRIRELVNKHDADVLHTHGYKADVYGYAAARRSPAALVATCHNWPSRLLSMRIYAAIDRLVLRHFDRVATASGPVVEILGRWRVPAHKLKTIPNGVDIEPSHEATPAMRKEFGGAKVVGFAGRLVEEKGGVVLLSAAPAILAAFPGVKFVFAGEGPARGKWEAMATRLGIRSEVVFAGKRDDMAAFYASVDMLVLPSFEEAMPMCLLEALAAAKPAIATPVGAVPTVVMPGVTGLLFQTGDAKALAAAVIRLLRDPELGRTLGENGRAHVMRHFASETIGKSYIDLYQEALHGEAVRMEVQAV